MTLECRNPGPEHVLPPAESGRRPAQAHHRHRRCRPRPHRDGHRHDERGAGEAVASHRPRQRALRYRLRRQDLLDGVTDQLIADGNLSPAARVNDRKNFEFVARPAFDEALIDRHSKHRDFIDRIFSDEKILRFIRAKVLDDVYRRLSEPNVVP